MKAKFTHAVSIPFDVMENCNFFGSISANIFFIEYEGELKQKKG